MTIKLFDWSNNDKNDDKIEFLFEKYHLSLLFIASQFVPRDIAEDIIQDIFLKLWLKRKKIEEIVSIKDYLYQAIKNECMNYIRSQSIEQRCLEKFTNEHFEEVIMDEEVFIQLSKAIAELPNVYRQVIEMSLEGKHADEIAKTIGVTRDAVNAYKKRAKSKLRKKLSPIFLPLIALI